MEIKRYKLEAIKMNTQRLFDTAHLDSFAKEWKAQSKNNKVLGYYCSHLPEEILYAAGVLPYRIRGTGITSDSNAESYLSPFSCSFCRGCFEQFLDGNYDFFNGFIASDGCLQPQRVYDNWKNYLKREDDFCYQFNAPRVYDEAALDMYRRELLDLKNAVERYASYVTNEKLIDAIRVYNHTRALLRELYNLRKSDRPLVTGEECLRITLASMSMRKDQFNELLEAFLEEAKAREPITDYRARLMLIGSSCDNPDYLKIFEDKGGLFVADVNCYGSRYLYDDVEIDEADPLMGLARSYLARPVCGRMCNLHHELRDTILYMAKEYNVEGIVYTKMKNCDMWGGESFFLDDKIREAGLALLILDREEITTNAGQVGIRAEAFVEMIETGGIE